MSLGLFPKGSKRQHPLLLGEQGVLVMGWRLPTLPDVTPVPLAWPGLTALFGMGRGEHRRHSLHYRCTALMRAYIIKVF